MLATSFRRLLLGMSVLGALGVWGWAPPRTACADAPPESRVSVSRPIVMVEGAPRVGDPAKPKIVVGDRVRIAATIGVDTSRRRYLVNLTVRPTKSALSESERRFAVRTPAGREKFPSPLTAESSWCPVEVVRISADGLHSEPPGSSATRTASGEVRVEFLVDTRDLADLLMLGPGEWEFEVAVQEERSVPSSRPGGEDRSVFVTVARESSTVGVSIQPADAVKYFDENDVELPDDLTTLGRADTLRLAIQFPQPPQRTEVVRLAELPAAGQVETRWSCTHNQMQFDAVVINWKGPARSTTSPSASGDEVDSVLNAMRGEFASGLKGIAGKPTALTEMGLFEGTSAEVLGGVWQGSRAVAHLRTVQFEQWLLRISVTAAAGSYRSEQAEQFLNSLCIVSVDPILESDPSHGPERP